MLKKFPMLWVQTDKKVDIEKILLLNFLEGMGHPNTKIVKKIQIKSHRSIFGMKTNDFKFRVSVFSFIK